MFLILEISNHNHEIAYGISCDFAVVWFLSSKSFELLNMHGKYSNEIEIVFVWISKHFIIAYLILLYEFGA